MSENNEFKGGEIKATTPFLKKLDNFWYHYKIHTIAAVCILAVLVILIMQTCSKVSYDAYILYAGPYEIKHTADGQYIGTVSSLKRVCEDFDGDGATNVNLLNLFVINDEEANELLADNPGKEINATLVSEDTETLGQTLLYGDYYVCFLSERLFLEYEERYEGALFAPIEKYLAEGREYEFASEHGVYLSSLTFYELPEISSLPSDTVVCIRALSEVSTLFGKSENEKSFARGERIITNILSYE